MKFLVLENLIRKRFHDNIGRKYSTIYENESREKPDFPQELWMRMSVKFGEKDQITLGSNRLWRIIGIVFVQIFLPVGQGTNKNTTLADEISDLFLSKTVDGVTYKTPFAEHIGVSNGYFQTHVRVPFYSDDLET